MAFNDELYEEICSIWPKTSVRSFSKILGRSTGYWSSIKSQNLRLSAESLMNLISTLEMQIMIATHAEARRKMQEVQRKISHELAQRFIEQIEADELVLKELEQLVQRNGQSKFGSSLPMPIFFSSSESFGGYR